MEVAGQRADQIDERFWLTSWHPLRSPSGEIVGVNVAAEEITERKRAEAALQASERQFHTLADSIPQLVWMADAAGKIYWFNSHWHAYAGPFAETGSQDWQAILAPESLDEVRLRWARTLGRCGTASPANCSRPDREPDAWLFRGPESDGMKSTSTSGPGLPWCRPIASPLRSPYPLPRISSRIGTRYSLNRTGFSAPT